jgi:hypothetical protein
MSSPNNAFCDTDLVQLEWVLAEVCAALEAESGPVDEASKKYVRRRLFMLAANGMHEPQYLRAHLLRSFSEARRSAA